MSSGRPPGDQIAQLGVEADAGKEIQEQHVARPKVEHDLQPKYFVSGKGGERRQQAAGDGLGNIPPPQRRDQMIEAGADKKHDNSDREGEQA